MLVIYYALSASLCVDHCGDADKVDGPVIPSTYAHS